ncbi:MAG TPA: type II secretion system F family protein [Candidatus Paceibacterota bacterium]|nr:type II secretion system F family protein [Candidatus Paceibacterota bacterium]
MKYRVTLKRADGSEEKRTMDAPSRFAVYTDAEKEGATVVSVDEGGGMPPFLAKLAEVQIGSGVKMEERITFTKNLSAMLTAGLSLSRALSVIERQSTNKSLKKIVVDLSERVKKGEAFHEALAAHRNIFSDLFIAMTKAGEESGTLAEALKVVARQMDRAHSLNKKIKGAMIYPSIILVAVVLIGILMLIYVVPTLSNTFKELGVELPAATKAVIGASDFMASHPILVLTLFAIIVAGIILFTRTKTGSSIVVAVALRIPVIGELVRETYSARAARALASLLSAGVEMLSALSITAEVVGERRFSKVIAEAETRVRKGETLSATFNDYPKLYPVFIADMIAVGEETGKVADMLGQVAEYYESDVEDRTKDLSTIIEPVLMLFIGGVVGIFALSMISPIYSLSDKI